MDAALPFAMVAAANVFQRAVGRVLDCHNITLPQWMALRILRRAGPEGIPMKRLSQCLQLSKAPMTGIMDRLEREGLARRLPDHTDRRVTRAVITEAGLERIERVKPELLAWKNSGLADFTPAEKQTLHDLLQRLLLVASEQP
jgi:DNA-binding MarR family transcriptional regulator